MFSFINDLGRLLARPRERQRELDELRRREVEALEYLAKRREGQTNDANVRDCDRIDLPPASEGARQWHEIDSQTPRDRFIILWCREDDSYWWAKWQGGMWFGSDEHGLRRTSESFTPDYWREIPIFAEPADTPDEGPDPLGYAKGET